MSIINSALVLFYSFLWSAFCIYHPQIKVLLDIYSKQRDNYFWRFLLSSSLDSLLLEVEQQFVVLLMIPERGSLRLRLLSKLGSICAKTHDPR